MPYTHLTQEERVALGALKRAGHTQAFIASQLRRDPSTISRELSRNEVSNKSGYHAATARLNTQDRRVQANQRFRKLKSRSLRRRIERKVKRYWSPEQIAGWLKTEHGIILSHPTIYAWVYQERPDLKRYLRHGGTKWRRRHGTHQREKGRERAKKKWIEERPRAALKRQQLGHWEGDVMEGTRGTGGALVHVERTSGYLLTDKVATLEAGPVRYLTCQRFTRLPRKKCRTITYDNGREFAAHEFIERETKAAVYFTNPYRAWEKGTCENTIGLLRQFFPKKTSFATLTQKDFARAARLLNTRPRKRLAWRTPAQVLNKDVAL